MGAKTVDQLLAQARARLRRLSPRQAAAAARAGARLVDIRADHQRQRDGLIPGAAVVPRNALEWRLDPASPNRIESLARRDLLLIVICDEGYGSSLAAATLLELGLHATDMVGGFQAWRADGLPTTERPLSGPARRPDSGAP